MTLNSVPSDKSAFHHTTSFNRPEMIESFCTKCSRFVVAGTRVGMVEIVESLHSCAADSIPAIRNPVQTVHH
jgi:hypothetical protein